MPSCASASSSFSRFSATSLRAASISAWVMPSCASASSRRRSLASSAARASASWRSASARAAASWAMPSSRSRWPLAMARSASSSLSSAAASFSAASASSSSASAFPSSYSFCASASSASASSLIWARRCAGRPMPSMRFATSSTQARYSASPLIRASAPFTVTNTSVKGSASENASGETNMYCWIWPEPRLV